MKLIPWFCGLLGLWAFFWTGCATQPKVGQMKQNDTPLHTAVKRGDIPLAKDMLNKGADVNARGEGGITPLMYAAQANEELLDFLVQKGAEISAQDNLGRTALWHACKAGTKQNVLKLLELGADPNAGSEKGCAPILVCIEKDDPEIAQILLDRGALVDGVKWPSTPLIAAARRGSVACTELLISKGADLNQQGIQKQTALMVASVCGHTNICACLIRAGARLDLTNESGCTALAAAISAHQLETARMLVDAGASCPENTNTLGERFCWAVYEKLLGDSEAARGNASGSQQAYALAQTALRQTRDEYAKASEEAKKAASKEQRKQFWRGMLVALAAGMADAGANYSSYSNYKSIAQASALRHSSTPQQYSANYRALMSHYHPSLYHTPTMSTMSAQPYFLPSGVAVALSEQAAEFQGRVKVCDKLLQEIELAVHSP